MISSQIRISSKFVRASLSLTIGLALLTSGNVRSSLAKGSSDLTQQIESTSSSVTLEPKLRWKGNLYELRYVSAGSYRSPDAIRFFRALSANFLATERITAMGLFKNGKPESSPPEISRVLLIYRAATLAYDADAGRIRSVPIPMYSRKIVDLKTNPVVVLGAGPSTIFNELLGSDEAQTAEAIRAIVTDESAAKLPIIRKFITDNSVKWTPLSRHETPFQVECCL